MHHSLLLSGENQAICFKFATHMYGNGVGSLRVWFRPNGEAAGEAGASSSYASNRILWEMTGDSGNNWYIAQLPIASSVSFQIAFEAIVGLNYLGNIAIDSISLEQGSCPSEYSISSSIIDPYFSFRLILLTLRLQEVFVPLVFINDFLFLSLSLSASL